MLFQGCCGNVYITVRICCLYSTWMQTPLDHRVFFIVPSSAPILKITMLPALLHLSKFALVSVAVFSHPGVTAPTSEKCVLVYPRQGRCGLNVWFELES